MTHTLTFYSVSEAQIDHVFSRMGNGPDKDGIIEGPTPFGHLKVRRDWDKGSGQLTIVVLEKPLLLTVDMIKSHIATALTEATAEMELETIRNVAADATTATAATTESTPLPIPPVETPSAVAIDTPKKKG